MISKFELWLLRKIVNRMLKVPVCRKGNMIIYFKVLIKELNQHVPGLHGAIVEDYLIERLREARRRP